MKKITLLIALSFCVSLVSAQFVQNWSKQYQATTAANFSNEGRRIAEDANSNVFVLGDHSADIDSLGQPQNPAQYTVRLRKYNYLGSLIYWRCIVVGGLINNGFDNRSGFGLELDGAGNVYIGYSVLNQSGNFDVVIDKYTNGLSLVWRHTYSTTSNDVGVTMKLSGTTVIAVVKSYVGANTTYSLISVKSNGTTSTPLYSFDQNLDVVNALAVGTSKFLYVSGYRLVSGVKNAMTASVNTTGTLKWKSTMNNGTVGGDDIGNDLVIGTDGNIYVAGTVTNAAGTGTDALIAKYATNGSLVSYNSFNRTNSDLGLKIANGGTGFMILGACNATSISVYRVSTAPGLFPTNSSLYTPTPVSPFTAVTNVTISDLKVAPSNNIYVCGFLTATSGAGNFSASVFAKFGFIGFNFIMLKADNVQGNNSDNIACQQLLLDGYKNDIVVLRNKWSSYSSHASETIEVVDYEGGASLRLAQEDQSSPALAAQVSVYPNPASDKVNIESTEKISSVEIADLTGNVVRSLKFDETLGKIDVSDLSHGLYICKITTLNGDVSMKRLMIN